MEFEVRTDLIDVTAMPSRITIHKATGREIPLVCRGEYWCSSCRDMHDEYTFDKRYNPSNFAEKRIGGTYKEYASGLKHYIIDGQEVAEGEFESKIAPLIAKEQQNRK